MRIAWNKGQTKETNSSVLKTSLTMKKHRLDNFSKWRNLMKEEGKIISKYPPLTKNKDLAELIGVILGDGSIHKYARTEELRVVSNSNNKGFIRRYAKLIEIIFNKVPSIHKRKSSNATDIRIYQKYISKRLGIPCGSKANLKNVLPLWIKKNPKFHKHYLRGLYEAEGSYCVHLPTYTHKFLFANLNPYLLEAVFTLLKGLGFHPHKSPKQIQLSRREEISRIIELLNYRKY